MIYDELNAIESYRALLGPHVDAIIAFLRRHDLDSLADGEYPIHGRDAYAIVQTYLTKPREQCIWESHRVYADIQLILRGREHMGRQAIEAMEVSQPYDESHDRILYAGDGEGITVRAGQFVIFLPQDVHMPGRAVGLPEEVRKIVVKVKL
jgi:YhcH/YjgK/YiaL family protein